MADRDGRRERESQGSPFLMYNIPQNEELKLMKKQELEFKCFFFTLSVTFRSLSDHFQTQNEHDREDSVVDW